MIYCKKIKFLSFTQFVPQSSEKVTFIEGGVAGHWAGTVPSETICSAPAQENDESGC